MSGMKDDLKLYGNPLNYLQTVYLYAISILSLMCDLWR